MVQNNVKYTATQIKDQIILIDNIAPELKITDQMTDFQKSLKTAASTKSAEDENVKQSNKKVLRKAVIVSIVAIVLLVGSGFYLSNEPFTDVIKIAL